MRENIFKMIEIAGPEDKSSLYYDRFMLVCIICSIVPLCFKQTNLYFIWDDRIMAGIFILDYLLRWGTADLKYPQNGKFAFLRYPFSLFALIDLLSILPVLTALNSGFKLFRLFRLNKAIRAFKLLRYSKSFSMITSVMRRERRALLAVCVLAGGYILLSALLMFHVEQDTFDTFFDAIYWSVITLTTVGYGDFCPVSNIGKLVGMASSFMGIAIVALPTGIITAGYMNELNKTSGGDTNHTNSLKD